MLIDKLFQFVISPMTRGLPGNSPIFSHVSNLAVLCIFEVILEPNTKLYDRANRSKEMFKFRKQYDAKVWFQNHCEVFYDKMVFLGGFTVFIKRHSTSLENTKF